MGKRWGLRGTRLGSWGGLGGREEGGHDRLGAGGADTGPFCRQVWTPALSLRGCGIAARYSVSLSLDFHISKMGRTELQVSRVCKTGRKCLVHRKH